VLNQVDKKESLDNICWFYSNFADKLYRNNYSNDAIEVIDGALTSFPGSSVTNNLVMLKNLFKASIKKRKENLELQINELHNQLYQGTSLYTLKQDLLTKQPEFLNLLQSLKSEDKRRCIDKICPLYLTLAEKLVELSYTTEAVELIDSALAHFPDTSINDNLVRLKVHAESLNEIFDTSDLNQ
jgi:flagellin-specific chaperone FliS